MTILFLAFTAWVALQDAGPPSLSAPQRRDVIAALSSLLTERYVSATEGQRVAGVLQTALETGRFESSSHPESFAAAVNELLQRETRDRHLYMWYAKGASGSLQFAAIETPMVARAEVLAGGIGYIDVRHFVGKTAEFDAAMEKLKGAVAIVIDLRQCVGGNREQVHHLSSYFFASPTRLLLRQARTDPAPIEHRTLESVPGPRFPDVAVYLLTSGRTFSAGEGFTLGLRVAGRALVVGERTAGGGHYVQGFPQLPHGFVMLLAVGRNLDPRTGRSWEGEGIAPDIAVPGEQALQAAIGHLYAARQ